MTFRLPEPHIKVKCNWIYSLNDEIVWNSKKSAIVFIVFSWRPREVIDDYFDLCVISIGSNRKVHSETGDTRAMLAADQKISFPPFHSDQITPMRDFNLIRSKFSTWETNHGIKTKLMKKKCQNNFLYFLIRTWKKKSMTFLILSCSGQSSKESKLKQFTSK